MKIHVKVLTGASYTVDTSVSASVRVLKLSIIRVVPHPIDEMQLLFQRKQLEDSQSLASVGVVDGSTVHLVLRLTAGFDVFVRTLTGKTIVIGVLSRDFIQTLKLRISDHEGIPLDQQILFFGAEELQDSKKVGSYGIKAESTLSLMLGGVSDLKGVKAAGYISELDGVARRHNLDASSVRGRTAVQVETRVKTAASVARMPGQIVEESKVQPKKAGLTVLFQLFTGEIIETTVANIDIKVGKLKEIVAKRFSATADDYRLYIGGKKMNSDTALRMYIPLNNLKQPIKVIGRKDQVVCQTSNSKQFRVPLFHGISVSFLKDKICTEKLLRPESVVLFLADRELSNPKELLETLTASSVISVSTKLRLFVRDLGGVLSVYSVLDSDDVNRLRSMVSAQVKVEAERCVLMYGGKLLSDGRLTGMKRDSVVDLQAIGKKG